MSPPNWPCCPLLLLFCAKLILKFRCRERPKRMHHGSLSSPGRHRCGHALGRWMLAEHGRILNDTKSNTAPVLLVLDDSSAGTIRPFAQRGSSYRPQEQHQPAHGRCDTRWQGSRRCAKPGGHSRQKGHRPKRALCHARACRSSHAPLQYSGAGRGLGRGQQRFCGCLQFSNRGHDDGRRRIRRLAQL